MQPRLSLLSAIVETAVSLRALGHRIVLVSSGAIGMGMRRMILLDESGLKGKWGKRPKVLAEKQALAAIGQGHLIALWDNLFSQLNQPIAQILLTRNDLADRSRYLNAMSTLSSLLSSGVIPIINENDTLAVSEIKFGDNDTLSAVTAGMCAADYLFLLTDVDCLYTENPRRSRNARPVRVVRDVDGVRSMVSTATQGSSLGTGGMQTKLIAAELATAAGVATVITHGAKPENIFPIITSPITSPFSPWVDDPSSPVLLGPAIADHPAGAATDQATAPLHTLFLPRAVPLADRKFWVAHGLAPRGDVIIDEGAHWAITHDASSPSVGTPSAVGRGRLLAAGVVRVNGMFMAGQAVRLVVLKGSGSRSRHKIHSPISTDAEPKGADGGGIPLVPASLVNSLVGLGLGTAASSPQTLAPEATAADPTQTCDEELVEIGRGLANYSAQEIDRIKGLQSSEIAAVLGHIDSEHVVDSIALLRPGGSETPTAVTIASLSTLV